MIEEILIIRVFHSHFYFDILCEKCECRSLPDIRQERSLYNSANKVACKYMHTRLPEFLQSVVLDLGLTRNIEQVIRMTYFLFHTSQ